MLTKLQEIDLLVFLILCFTVSVTPSINTPESSTDFVIKSFSCKHVFYERNTIISCILIMSSSILLKIYIQFTNLKCFKNYMVLCNPFPNSSFAVKKNQNTNQNYVK